MPLPVIFTAANIPGLVATFIRYLVGYAISKTITALGITLVTFKALDYVADMIVRFVESNTASAGGEFWHVAVALGVPDAIKIVTSAYVAAISIRQMMGMYDRITYGKS